MWPSRHSLLADLSVLSIERRACSTHSAVAVAGTMRCAELTAQPAGKGVGRHFRHCWEGQCAAPGHALAHPPYRLRIAAALASRSSALRGSQLAVPTPCRKTVRPKVRQECRSQACGALPGAAKVSNHLGRLLLQVAQPTQAVAQVDAKTQAHAQKITVSTNGSEFGATEMSRVRLPPPPARCRSLHPAAASAHTAQRHAPASCRWAGEQPKQPGMRSLATLHTVAWSQPR